LNDKFNRLFDIVSQSVDNILNLNVLPRIVYKRFSTMVI